MSRAQQLLESRKKVHSNPNSPSALSINNNLSVNNMGGGNNNMGNVRYPLSPLNPPSAPISPILLPLTIIQQEKEREEKKIERTPSPSPDVPKHRTTDSSNS